MALTQVSTGGVKDGTILNADLNASAAIAGTKISPSFGSQNISTTGTTSIGGATSVGTKLHIENASGDAHIRLRGSANYGILFTRHSDAALTGYVGSGNAVNLGTSNVALSAPLSGGDIIFQTNGTAATDEKMRIQDDGKIGVNTTAPSELFTINGADQSALIRTSNAVGTAKLKFEADGTNYAGIGLENTTLVLRCGNSSSPSSRLRLGADGVIVSSGNMRVNISTAVDGILGQAYSGYFGLKHADQTLSSEYMIISNDNDTYISCSAGSSVRIRPSANNSSHELLVTTNITLAKGAFGAGTTAIDPDSYTDYSGGFGSVADGSGWGGRGLWIQAGGIGRAAAIAHNGANLYFGIQNGSNQNTMGTYMMIEPTGDITLEKDLRFISKRIKREGFQYGYLEGGQNNIGASDQYTNPIFSIGSAHRPTATALVDMYGIGFSHGNASFTPTGAGWGLYACADGDTRIYLDASNARVYLDSTLDSNNTDAMYLAPTTGNYGSIQINGGTTGGWKGYSIDGHSVFMSNGTTAVSNYIGIYDDNVNQWALLHARTAWVRLYYGSGLKLETTNAGVYITGTLTASGTKSFRISHPLSNLSETKDLVHAAIEGPQMDLMYRGKVDLVNGTATVNIDTKSGMTEGTFDVLNRDVQCFTTNETGWTNVKGSVTGNKLTIVAENNSCTDTISWMVIGERKDNDVVSSEVTNDNGDLIVEPDKQVIDDDPKMDD